MRKKSKYLFLVTLVVSGLSVFALSGGKGDFAFPLGPPSPNPDPDPQTTTQQTAPKDTTARYPVKKTQITGYEDLDESFPIDLRDPSNIKSEVEYDSERQLYLFKTKIGDGDWVTTLTMSPEEYNKYLINKSMSSYFRSKYEGGAEKGDSAGDFSLKDIKISLGPAERIFGPGGVQIKTQGYTEISMGIKHNSTDDPTKSERNRSQTMFDFDQKIQMNVKASVGDKVNFDLNYDTEASFDFDSKKIKLAYEGKEDEILKRLEAGNVSMATTNSLINGGTALFGIRADLQFGKLKISSVISQQESQSKTVNSKGGVQTTSYEFMADQYDENRHFFLGHYFRDNYDKAMSTLPTINSPVTITQMEVWVTNKRGNFDQARNVVAFADIAETDSVHRNDWKPPVGSRAEFPSNSANPLYQKMVTEYPKVRDITQVTNVLGTEVGLESGQDYEKIESARMLSSSEYTYNANTGYISLKTALQSDEVLGVAYSYRAKGEVYKVGEFSTDIGTSYNEAAPNTGGALYLKLLKPVSLSPNSFTWHLMMKNVYALGAYQLQEDKFRLNISYLSDSTGTYLTYLPEGPIKNELLLRVMNLDRLNSRKNAFPDGIFDFMEGYTVNASNGRIIFPVVEPFGSHLAKKLGNDEDLIKKYVYQELYDMTLTEARQVAEKNKFKMSGEYRASNSSQIDLGSTNVPNGSVKVTAAGVTLTENVDYTVDYVSGIVTIINSSYDNSSVSVSLEDRTLASAMQRRTMLGLNVSYDFSKDFTIGGTFMHMYEKPLTMKAEVGSESLKNTLWGLNASFRTESQWLTNLVDKLPFYNATAPSSISFTGEFAQMIPGHYESKYSGGYSYLDDFERSTSKLDIRSYYSWFLASTPADKAKGNAALFPEALLSNGNEGDIEYNKNRAHLAWFTIDNMFTRENSSLTPQHIRNDKEQLSNHFVREIYISELYPNRDVLYNETATISALNVSYYPSERGMYNIYTGNSIGEQYNRDGSLTNPDKRWGGMMRKMDNKDFEANNIEYIEFWLMDPFVYNGVKDEFYTEGGDLYFNLGEVSEDILKDGKKFYENGLPADGDPSAYGENNWGRYPTRPSTVYAFDDNNNAREIQDVGYNGLNSEQEKEYRYYKEYLEKLEAYIDPETYNNMMNDPLQLSPFYDPSGDTFHYFRGSDYDREEVSILDRYKRFNGTEGNSKSQEESGESYGTAARRSPDVEDIDQDYNMNETESYYQYKVSLYPDSMQVGTNHIVDQREVTVPLRNGTQGKVKWYQFKIPVRGDQKETIGNIRDFKSIRFMRMFMTKFKQPTFLRFGTLDLVRGDWRVYTNALDENTGNGSIVSTTVNIEENGDRIPVNYVLPPGVTRIIDPSQPQLTQENEQAMSLKVTDLAKYKESVAVYKNTGYDLRRFKRIQMFSHAEAVDDANSLTKGELTIFLRLGSDYKNNYYEYEIPLTVTPWGTYSSNNTNDQETVWPKDNMFDFPLDLLKDVKLERNKEKRKAGSEVSFTSLYSTYDPDKPSNKVSVVGNPSLSEIKVIMIGVRNDTRYTKSGEIWVNEMRLTDFDEEGGWAAQGNLNITLSDLATINVSGRKETIGFGGLDQSLMERRSDDLSTYNIAANIDFGKLLPEKAQVTLPFYYSYSNQTTTPKYDPLDQDVTLKESLELVDTKAEKDSIRNLAQEKSITKNISISNARVNIRSKNPMPYDPANLSFSYSYNKQENSNPTTVRDLTQDYRASLTYNYSPVYTPWEPFKSLKNNKGASKFLKSLSFGYIPNNITFNTTMTRNYNEVLTRDLDSYTLGGEDNSQNQFLSWSQSFYWDRDFSLTWDFTKNLKFSFNSGTRAEIEEPNLQVNKKVNPDDYEIWRDEVWQSIKNLGTPLSYKQNAKLTYTLPFAAIPILDWINSSASYDVSYTWDRGADLAEDMEIGNNIKNNSTLTINSRFNLLNFYNKWDFLKKVNQKFDGGSSSSRRSTSARERTPKPVEKKKFEKEVVLLPDSVMIVKHNLNTKNIRVVAKYENGRSYPLKFKKSDNNSIKITDIKDTANIKLSIVQGPDPTEGFWYKAAQYTARGLMSVRSLSVNYSRQEENYIYGFRPMIGDIFGQQNGDSGLSPGLGFAFGFKGGESYIEELMQKDQLVINDSTNISPAIFNINTRLDIRATIEPIKGLKIDLTALREERKSTELQFMYEGMPRNLGGSFSMTTIALSTAFKSSSSKNNYNSEVFNKFLEYRNTIARRLDGEYRSRDVRYPSGGFMSKGSNTTIQGELYSTYPVNGINENSSDVLIPAFLAAYTGKSPDKIGLSAFPSLSALLPNWSITYDGLLDLIPALKSKFKSFKLNHAYTCQYRVGSYSSYSDWLSTDGNYGFTASTLDDSPLPSSPYIIPSVSLTEAFNPLFGMEGTLVNSMTLRTRYNKSRNVNLNTSSYQIVETSQNELVIGVGYKITNFNRVLGIKDKTIRGFSNDLNVMADVSHRKSQSLIRKIEEGYTQATSGTSIFTIKISADYSLSRALTLKAFFDRIVNSPLISSSSYPTTNTNFGISLRFTLTQ